MKAYTYEFTHKNTQGRAVVVAAVELSATLLLSSKLGEFPSALALKLVSVQELDNPTVVYLHEGVPL